jgi:pimeloyl-ACP methyl ester carboxylesterase
MQESFRIAGKTSEPALLMRRQHGDGPVVLYIHGATFPSALSVAYRFGGRSWMDDLSTDGFDTWALDFAGYGGSDRYEEMSAPREGEPLGRAMQASAQIARAVEHIVGVTASRQVSIIAHSWGSIAAGVYATAHPGRVARLCLFGPIAQRGLPKPSGAIPRWNLVTIADQRARFTKDVPAGHPPVLIEPELECWGPAYLATDRLAAARRPPAVQVPSGPLADIADAWSGALAYRPQDIRAPVLVVRGEWDSVSGDADAQWLLARTPHPSCRDAKIPESTHLMHLEHSREDLFAAVRGFLKETRS